MCACKVLIFIPIWLKFRINIADLNVWSYKETCQRQCEGGYSHAVALTHLQMHTHRYFLGVKATVTHHAPTGGGASHWLPQGWQADDSAHSVAAAKDRLQKLENSCLLTTNTNCGFTKYSALIDTILTPIFAQLSTLDELNNCWKFYFQLRGAMLFCFLVEHCFDAQIIWNTQLYLNGNLLLIISVS